MAIVIFFTPLKRLVPGYATPSQHPDYIRLSKKMASLEAELADYKTYYDYFNRMISLPDSIETPDMTHTSKVIPEPVEKSQNREKNRSEENNEVQPVTVNASLMSSDLNIADYRYLMPPISGVVSNGFDLKTDHLGADILAPHDTPVKAIWDGHVITADWTLET